MLRDFIFVLLFFSVSTNARSKLLIDNDAGGDDAMAIFLALLYEKYFDGPQLIALTTGNGNTNEDNVSRNNQRILKVAQRQDVPIYRGSKSSIVFTPESTNYFGKDGLGDVDEVITDLVPPQQQNAVDALISLSKKYEGELTVVTIGALTNVALAIKVDPGFLNRLAHLYIGAGHINGDNHPEPEFNAHVDVEAYHIVMQSATPDKVSVFPFSQTYAFLNFTKEWRLDVLGAIDTDIMRAQNQYERIAIPQEDGWAALDPSVVAAVINPNLVEEYKYSKYDIILCGDKRGINTNEFVEQDKANVRIVYKVNSEEYKQFLLDVFSAELKTKSGS
ncbi:uncharacterized protein LOC126382129 isoform X2 [Pectinophora gossypiella]|uniref:uncharacterized protein LOC126382129 isoform X2 n=1 Tax=Pectinophora gossypiella TaxID=13191 RepID=UPI00214EECAC|nr:uncharacterized protein LOC126382129 isoform X2 [Pectinophora gossypiella]